MAWCISQRSCTLADSWCQWDIGQSTHIRAGLLTTKSVPIHKLQLSHCALLCTPTKLTGPCYLKPHSRNCWQSTCRGNSAFWCSDVHCSVPQSGPAAAPVPGGHKPSKRRCEQRLLAWRFMLFLQQCKHLQWVKHWRIKPSHETERGAQPEPDPAVLQRPCTVAWALSMCHKANVRAKAAHVTLAEVL